MVSQKFVTNLNALFMKELSAVLNGQPYITPMGAATDQYKGFGDELKTRIIPFHKSEYQAQEFLFIRLPFKDQYLPFFDMLIPIVNIQDRSVQGVSTFVATVPYPIPETFVNRMVGWGYKIVPHKLVVEQNIEPKKIIKGNMITSKAVNAMNADKKLGDKVHGSRDCTVQESGLRGGKYEVKFNEDEYPPGMFTIIPFHGSSILIIKEAGAFGSEADKPFYYIKDRYEGLSGVAKYLATYPEHGEEVGQIYMDKSLEILLPPLLKHLSEQKK